MKLQDSLKLVGLNEREAKIYLALLEFGEANLKEIADRSEIPRTSLYTSMKNLIEKRIVEFYKKSGRKYYVAASPERVFKIYESNLDIFEKNIPELHNLMGEVGEKPSIKFFEGKKGIRLIFNEILEEKRNFQAITCIEDMNHIAVNYFADFIDRRIDNNLRVKLLTNRSKDSQDLKNRDRESLRETRFVPREYRFDTANYIFGDRVAILSLKKQPIMGILIEDTAIAQTHKMYFDLIWKMASST